MISKIQRPATTSVIRVNRSPARDPNALDPPTPPKAPDSPPPLPRWIKTRKISTNPKKITRIFRMVELHGIVGASTGESAAKRIESTGGIPFKAQEPLKERRDSNYRRPAFPGED